VNPQNFKAAALLAKDLKLWLNILGKAREVGKNQELLVLIAAAVVAFVAVRRGAAGGPLSRVSTILVGILLAAYLVAIWAMTTKPGA
jgi:hypothetical protein